MAQVLSYGESLANFFDISNELDEFTVLYATQLLPKIKDHISSGSIACLDVGSAEGYKTKIMIRYILAQLDPRELLLTAAEPDAQWHGPLFQNLSCFNKMKKVSLEVVDKTLEDILIEQDRSNYNIIALHQLLYDQNQAELLINQICKQYQQTSSKSQAIYISVENEDNILFQLRRVIEKQFDISLPYGQTDFLIDQLRMYSIKHFRYSTKNKIMLHPKYVNAPNRLLWFACFLTGLDKKSYQSLDIQIQKIIENTIIQELDARNLDCFPINEDHTLVLL